MKIKRFISETFEANCYLIISNGEGIVVDPCVDIKQLTKNENINITSVFITHGHFDHILRLDSYLNNSNITFYMHQKCISKLKNPMKNCSYFIKEKISFDIDLGKVYFVKDNEEININGNIFKILYTPGHSDCSISIMIEDNIFTGDTIFKSSVGRTDLYSGSESQLNKSLDIYKSIKNNYTLYPGHEEATTLEVEKGNNNFLR